MYSTDTQIMGLICFQSNLSYEFWAEMQCADCVKLNNMKSKVHAGFVIASVEMLIIYFFHLKMQTENAVI